MTQPALVRRRDKANNVSATLSYVFLSLLCAFSCDAHTRVCAVLEYAAEAVQLGARPLANQVDATLIKAVLERSADGDNDNDNDNSNNNEAVRIN